MGLLQQIYGAKAKAQGRPCPLIAVRLNHPKQFLGEGHVPETAEVLLVN